MNKDKMRKLWAMADPKRNNNPHERANAAAMLEQMIVGRDQPFSFIPFIQRIGIQRARVLLRQRMAGELTVEERQATAAFELVINVVAIVNDNGEEADTAVNGA